MKTQTGKKPAPRADVQKAGNVTIDLGETIEKKLLAAGLRTDLGKSPALRTGNLKGGPVGARGTGLFGGYRPWYDRFGRPSMGETTASKVFNLIPTAIRQVQTHQLLGGLGLGILGNRTLVRLTPRLVNTNSKLLVEGIAFLAGLVPLMFSRNAYTMGTAIPGAIMLASTIVDRGLDMVGLGAVPGAELRGAASGQGASSASAARQKLASIQNRINVAQATVQGQTSAQHPLPRVVAKVS